MSEREGEIQPADCRNGKITVSQQQFHYPTAKGNVIDQDAADIGCFVNVDVKKASVGRFDPRGDHIPEDADFPQRIFVI